MDARERNENQGMKAAWVYFVCFVCFVVRLSAETTLRVPHVRLPLMKTPPTMDGEVKDDEWAGAARMERFGWGELLSPQEASFWVGCDGKELFIAVLSETPPGGKILSRVQPVPEDGDARTWLDDSVEMVLDPVRGDPSRRRLFHVNLNALGAINDTAYRPNGTGEGWRGNWRTASKVIGDRWHFEVAVPLADMGATAEDARQPMGVRVCRNWMQQNVGPQQTEWGAIAGAFLNPDTIPVVRWDERAPVVQVLQLHDPGKENVHLRVAIRNPHAEPVEVLTAFECVPSGSSPTKLERAVNVAPNAVEVVEFTGNGLPGETVTISFRAASPDGSAVYYLRDFRWKLGRPEPMWVLDEDAAKKVDVNFAYYPYHNTIKTVVNIAGLAEREKVKGVKVGVRKKFVVPPSDGPSAAPTKVGTTNMKTIASVALPPLQNFSTRMEWKIPALKEGRYEFLVGLQGVTVEPTVVPFVRHVMAWEHNRLGKSNAVIEPFTPIRVEKQTVSTVLRTHALNNLGLFDQIEALGKPLLKSPVRLEVNGVAVAGRQLRFIEKKPHRVVSESQWLAGTTRAEWDYDGLMKWTLEIGPSKQPIESLTLVIPLDDKLAPLFHACTDGLRFNYAGATPAGQGRVWDGSKAARNSIIGSYVPYIWLGAEERGLAVFGENDRGWVRDPKIPCQELVRNGDTLELRLNLIAAPTRIDQPRRIVIGFQTTPTKPMPDGWRRWTVGCARPKEVDLDFAWLGSCFYWGTLGPCSEIYPRNEDFSLYEKFAETRRTGEIDQKFIEKWLAGYPPNMDAYFTNAWPPHINAGFHVMKHHKSERMLVYTNARGARFDTREGQTFLDEWHRDAFPTRQWGLGGSVAYDMDPTESFRDYAMWYYRKMFDTFVEDIYWDDIFLQSNFDTVGTDAYELPDGTIQPSSGLFHMRELIRRTAVFQHERKKRGFNMAHMTNTGIAPILSFCGTQLAWEDRAGDADFQDRYSRDYLRAESIGRQFGTVPYALTLLNGSHTDPKNKWVLRTNAGVTLTHEIKPSSAYLYPDYWSNYVRLLEFGYGKPGVHVWNYWQEDYPAQITGSETSSLIVSKSGSAILVVCDYGNGGEVTVKLDPSLGLGKFTAEDIESSQPLVVGADGAISFPLKKHDFRVILVEASKQ